MATVITLAATRSTSETLAVALAFALGAAGPLLAVGYGGRAVARRAGGMTGHGLAQRAFGGLMLLTCAAMLFNLDLRAQDAVASALPADWTARLYGVEEQAPAQRALAALQAPAAPTPFSVNPVPPHRGARGPGIREPARPTDTQQAIATPAPQATAVAAAPSPRPRRSRRRCPTWRGARGDRHHRVDQFRPA